MTDAVAWPLFPRPRVASRGPPAAGAPPSDASPAKNEDDPPKDEQGRNDPCGGDSPLAAGARKTAGTDPLASHPLTSTSADVHAGRGGVDTSHRDGEYAKFRAVLRKNFTLKTRGSQLWCTILEVLVPVAFIALMCLPRLFISDESVEMTLHRPAPIQSITWSGRVPGGPTGDGPYRLLWSPVTNADAERVAESAAIDLLCGGGFMTQVALASSVELDQDAIAEHGILDVPEVLAGCRNDPSACAGFVKRRGGVDSLGPDSATANPLTLAWLCTDSCLARRECYRPVIDEFLVGFPTETAAMTHAMVLAERGRSVAAVVSLPGNLSRDSRRVEYKIRVNATDVPTGDLGARWSSEKFERWVVGEDTRWRTYWTYANIQKSFDQALMSLIAGDKSPAPREVQLLASVKGYPFPAYSTNLGSTFASVFFGLVYVFTFCITVVVVVKGVTVEKELRIREGMKIFGLSDLAYWSSWFVTSYTSLLLVSLLVSVVGIYPFRYTDWTLTFAFLALWTCQLVAFCFCLTTLFSSAKVAAIASALVYVVTWVPGVSAVAADNMGSDSWIASCVMMPATCVYMWGWVVSILENAQKGARWDTLSLNLLDGGEISASEGTGTFSGALVLGVTACNAVAYAILAWYLDQVIPGPFGRTRSWWFVFDPSYWLDKKSSALAVGVSGPHNSASLPDGMEPVNVDKNDAVPMIRVEGLVKTFGSNRAVDGLHFAAHRGQITALLGHNGAGKTTTISVLTGMINQDGGAATIDGMSVETDMQSIRKDLGVCPQFDVLWPTLTAREHLELFARFRGVPESEITREVNDKIAAVGLESKAECEAGVLSGGQRRKLSVAVAFVGNPSVVILDEPTSGMDPRSRRYTWEVIRGFRRRMGTTILLTTHFMDEADILSDRVAIMYDGKMACVGSPLYLKTRFGSGYRLTVVLGDSAESPAAVDSVVLNRIKGAMHTSTAGSTASYAVPASQRASLPDVLNRLESRRDVVACGVSCSTMEDVFLNVAELEKNLGSPIPSTAPASEPDAVRVEMDEPSALDSRVHGLALYRRQFHAMLWKRAIHARRDRLGIVTMYVVPILFVVLGIAVSKISNEAFEDPPPAVMDRSYLGDLPTAFSAATTLDVQRVTDHLPPSEVLPVPRTGGAWRCWTPSPVVDVCRPDAFDPIIPGCPNCTAPEDLQNTIDGFLLSNIPDQATCANPEHTDNASCAALLVDSAAGFAVPGRTREVNYTVMVSSTAYHALPASLASFHDAVFKALHHDAPDATLVSINHPMPTTSEQKLEQAMLMHLVVSLCALLGLACLSASASAFLVWERTSASKHLQMVSGLHRGVFWAGAYVWDLIAFGPPLAIFLVIFAASEEEAYTGESFAVVAAALGLFALSAPPLAYLLHWPFENNMACLAGQMGAYFFFGVAQIICAVVLGGLAEAGVDAAETAWEVLQWAFRWLPHYCVARVLFNLAGNHADVRLGLVDAKPKGPWHPEVSGRDLGAMAACAAAYALLNLAIEYEVFTAAWWRRRLGTTTFSTPGGGGDGFDDGTSDEDEDEDAGVRAERVAAAAAAAPGSSRALVVRNLRKRYPRRRRRGGGEGFVDAVRGVSIAVPSGECFGLLGVNGAGKTTTFKMLSGQFPPTSGDASVTPRGFNMDATSTPTSFNILTNLARVRQHVGYCPQFDALQGTMTAVDHLLLYASLRGFAPARAVSTARDLIDRLGIQKYATLPASGYSGGTKRKLSVAISLVGDPAVVLLDEPSTGMDPTSRRQLWGVLQSTCRGRAVVLTSHSMEECEALCHRAGIMVAGKLRCLGPIQRLKSEHGAGYSLDLRVGGDGAIDAVRKLIERRVPDATLKEECATRLRYGLPSSAVASVFALLEDKSNEGLVQDYQLGQTTLEEVFLRFAEGGEEDE